MKLTSLERTWARGLVHTFFPGARADLDRFFDEIFSVVPAPTALVLRAAMVLGAVPEARRLEVLEALGRSDVYVARSAFNLLKATAARACAAGAR